MTYSWHEVTELSNEHHTSLGNFGYVNNQTNSVCEFSDTTVCKWTSKGIMLAFSHVKLVNSMTTSKYFGKEPFRTTACMKVKQYVRATSYLNQKKNRNRTNMARGFIHTNLPEEKRWTGFSRKHRVSKLTRPGQRRVSPSPHTCS